VEAMKNVLAVVSVLAGMGLGLAPWVLQIQSNHLALLAFVGDGSVMVLFGFALLCRG
jgi:hypothetical protein